MGCGWEGMDEEEREIVGVEDDDGSSGGIEQKGGKEVKGGGRGGGVVMGKLQHVGPRSVFVSGRRRAGGGRRCGGAGTFRADLGCSVFARHASPSPRPHRRSRLRVAGPISTRL